MSTELEQRLREDMDAFTQGLRVPAGFAAKVYARRHRRQRTARALIAGGLATALAGGAAAVALLPRGSRVVDGQRMETAAYVIPQVRHALSAAALSNMVVYTRMTHQPQWTWQPMPGRTIGQSSTGATAGADSYVTSVRYHGRWEFSAFDQDGKRVFSELATIGKSPETTTAVIYSSHTWWTATTPPTPLPKKTSSCVTNGNLAAWKGPSGDWPDLIQAELSCGAFRLAGTQVVDGVNAIKIIARSDSALFDPVTFTLWVDPSTYLPVRIVDSGAGQSVTQMDSRWLPPTPANRALVDLSVPAGFKRVAPPASS
jgi:hypothetical protein